MKTLVDHLKLKHIVMTLIIMVGSVGIAADLENGVATTGVNFRAEPNGRVITGVGKGEFFEIMGQEGKWTKVRLATGQKGYIYSKYVAVGRPDVPETEGGFCENCLKQQSASKIEIPKETEIAKVADVGGGPGMCVTNKLIAGAKNVLKNKYRSRSKGKGKCALAVRQSLNKAGIWQGGGIGHAKDMVPGMQRMGFKNIKTSNMTPDSAPAGSILVYGRAKKGARGCRGLGTTYGHVEIKESKSSYIYDGNPKFHIQKAYGAQCRPLIAVMQMGSSCPTCTKSVKQACGV